ncbi:MAG: retropepsin-like aspartic protease [Firmicutes bacterium]|nr:retropepsin-like aspartic protease [Bacillota bacterium]
MDYASILVEINGEPSLGIVVGDVTYVIWTALNLLGTPYEHTGYGMFTIDGQTVQGVVVDGNTYLPWGVLAPDIRAEKIDGGWNFVTDVATSGSQNSQPIAVIDGSVQQDAFYFTLTVNGTDVPDMIMDTGAFELTFNAQVADALGLPNLGAEEIGGVGGSAQAYQSQCDLTIGGHSFTNVPCIVDPSFTSNGLFGLRFYIDNQLQLQLNPIAQTLTISPA